MMRPPPSLAPDRQQIIDEQRTARRETARRDGLLPPFRGEKWAHGDFSGTVWTGEDFAGCDLTGADFHGCTFYDADLTDARLHDADLRDTDFTGARGLLPEQLAGADLTRAKLPEEVAKLPALEHSDKLSESAAKVFFTFLLAMVFAVVTAAGIKDFDLINNRGTAKLPVLDVEVPALHFMWGVSLLLCILFLYLHIYLQRLWEVLATLPAILPDGRKLDEATHPWLINDLCRDHILRLRRLRTWFTRIQNCICGLLAYVIPGFVMIYLWAGGLRTQQAWIIGWQYAFLAIVIVASPCFSVALRHVFARTEPGWRELGGLLFRPFSIFMFFVGLVLLVGTALISIAPVVGVMGVPILLDERPIWMKVFYTLGGRQSAEVADTEFTKKPPTWPGYEFATAADAAKVPTASFQDVHWDDLDASQSFLSRCKIERGRALGAEFPRAECFASSWTGVDLTNASFHQAHFNLAQAPELNSRSQFTDCYLDASDFSDAGLQYLSAKHCTFNGADLGKCHASCSSWHGCSFQRARLDEADLSKATFENFMGFRSDGAHVKFTFASLVTAQRADLIVFIPCDFTDASFNDAILRDTDLSQVIGLTWRQIEKAKDLTGMVIPSEWLIEHPDWVEYAMGQGAVIPTETKKPK